MTEREASEIVLMLATAFRGDLRGMNEREVAAWGAVYRRGIADMVFDEAKAGVERLIKGSKFMPRVAEIREAVVTATRGQRRTGAEAWGDVKKLHSRFSIHRHPQDADYTDELVRQVVQSFGWAELCNSENQVSDRARFIEAYEQLAVQGRIEAQISAGAAAPALPSRTGQPLRLGAAVAAAALPGGKDR